MTDEHVVAIVSFEGALKREIKRVRKELQKVDDLSSFSLKMEVKGRVHEGDVKLSYGIGSEYGTEVTGDSLNAVLDEYLRRHGWKKVHEVKALSYEKIPSDDSVEPEEDPLGDEL